MALVLVPQSLAYAVLAGLPPVFGLYAAALPPLVAALFTSSRYLQTGPVAITSLLTLAALSPLATPGSADYLHLAPLLALVVGLCRLAIGLLRAGFVAYWMSQPVLLGFTSAAALLIVASQLPVMLGLPGVPGHLWLALAEALTAPTGWSLVELALGGGTVGLIVLGRRVHPLFPGVLLAALLGVVFARFAGLPVATVGALPAAWPAWRLDLDVGALRQLLVPGLLIALIGFAEPAAIARTLAARNRQAWSANRELFSQGMANLAAAAAGAFPVGGSFSRTMVNQLAGGRTAWSGAVTGVTVLLLLPFAELLASLPKAVLAGIIVASVLGLIQPRALLDVLQVSRAQGLVGLATFGLTLGLAPRIDLAVMLGIGLGVAVHLWRERRISVAVAYDSQRALLRLTPAGVLYFGAVNVFEEALLAELAKRPSAKHLVLDLRHLGRLDYTGALVLKRLAEDALAGGLSVQVIPGQAPQGGRLLRRVFGEDSPILGGE